MEKSWAGERVLARCGNILDDWEERIREVLPEIAGTPRLILRDYLIDYLHRLAEAFDRVGSGEHGAISTTHASVHGRLRATTPAYDLRHVVTEYRILREVVRKELEAERALTAEEHETLVTVTEEQIEAAAEAFAQSLSRVRAAVVQGVGHSLLPTLGDLLNELRGLREDAADPAYVQRCLDLAERLLEQTDAMTRSIHIEAGDVLEMQFEEGDLSELLRDIVHEACLTYGDHFRFEGPSRPVEARFSKGGVERAVENLLDTARRFGGLRANIQVSLDEEGADIVIGVHNLGVSLDETGRRRMLSGLIDEPASDERGMAWGVGLRLVKDVAQAHRGGVEVTDGREQGVSVVIRLPKDGPAQLAKFLVARGRAVPQELLPPQKRQRS